MRRCRAWIGRRAARWTFDPPDFEKFPLLKLAYEAQETGRVGHLHAERGR